MDWKVCTEREQTDSHTDTQRENPKLRGLTSCISDIFILFSLARRFNTIQMAINMHYNHTQNKMRTSSGNAIETEMSNLAYELGQIGPKWDKSGTF